MTQVVSLLRCQILTHFRHIGIESSVHRCLLSMQIIRSRQFRSVHNILGRGGIGQTFTTVSQTRFTRHWLQDTKLFNLIVSFVTPRSANFSIAGNSARNSMFTPTVHRPAGVFRKHCAGVSFWFSRCRSVLAEAKNWASVTVSQRYLTAGIQKNVSSLTAKRPVRKKAQRVTEKEKEEHVDVVVAYAVAEELDLSPLKDALLQQGLYHICELPIDVQDGLHVRARYAVDGNKREVFFFRDGSVVFWSMPETERKEVLKFTRKYDISRYDRSLILKEREEMDLKYIQGPTSVVGDTLQLNEESEEGHATLEKYAFSNALAQSVKLAIWEASLEKFVESIEFVTEDLRDGQQIRMSRREVLRKTGELFALRHLINLSSDLLDVPDFYWDRASLEPLYMAVYNHLDISRRTRVMNEKLSHCCELTELLSSHLNDAHHTRLEVMIIVLIMVEVVFEIIHYLERYVSTQSEESSLPQEPSAQEEQPLNNT